MKKLLVSLVVGIGLLANAATVTVTIPATTGTNVPTILNPYGTNGAPFTLLSAVLVPASGCAANVYLYDSPLYLWYTNAAYSNITSYVTNYIAMWTNYYGYTNYWTNASLIDVTNSVLGTSNAYPVALVLAAPTNVPTTFVNLNTRFRYGCLITNTVNTAQGTPTLTLTYTQ